MTRNQHNKNAVRPVVPVANAAAATEGAMNEKHLYYLLNSVERTLTNVKKENTRMYNQLAHIEEQNEILRKRIDEAEGAANQSRLMHKDTFWATQNIKDTLEDIKKVKECNCKRKYTPTDYFLAITAGLIVGNLIVIIMKSYGI